MNAIIGLVLAAAVLSVTMAPLKFFEEEIRAAVSVMSDRTRKICMSIAMVWAFGPVVAVFIWSLYAFQ